MNRIASGADEVDVQEWLVLDGLAGLLVVDPNSTVFLSTATLVRLGIDPMRRNDINVPLQRAAGNLDRLGTRLVNVGRRKSCFEI